MTHKLTATYNAQRHTTNEIIHHAARRQSENTVVEEEILENIFFFRLLYTHKEFPDNYAQQNRIT